MNNRISLIETYLELGSQKGFDNVSLSDIAKKADIRKASIFSHFESFEDLKNRAVAHCLEALSETDFEINPKANDVEQLFIELINSFIDAFSSFPISALLLLADQKRTYDSKFRNYSEKIDLMLASRFQVALDYCVQRSWSTLDNTDEVASLFACKLRALLLQDNLSDEDLTAFLRTVLHLL